MRAIIISAGQGRRLLPHTETSPKCLLPVVGTRSLLEVQLRTLAECGIHDVSIMVGFRADQVEQCVKNHAPAQMDIRICYNPFFATSDNLITVWLARSEMEDDFILLNGDTLFEAAALQRLLASPPAPLTLAVDVKDAYDDDDMKVSLAADGRLTAVGKTLSPEVVDAESIGLMLFRGDGVPSFKNALETAVRDPENVHSWYLSVVNELSRSVEVRTTSIEGLWWGEVDCHEDLAGVRADLGRRDEELETASGTEPTPLRAKGTALPNAPSQGESYRPRVRQSVG